MNEFNVRRKTLPTLNTDYLYYGLLIYSCELVIRDLITK